MKKSFFAAGVLFGTAGIILLTSNAAHPRRLPLYRVLQPAFDSARRGRSACTDRFRASAQSFHLGHFAQEHDRSFAETAGKSGRTADRIKPQRRQNFLPPLFCIAKTTARTFHGRLSLFCTRAYSAFGAPTGQTDAQAPHSMQVSASITYLSSPAEIADTGHSDSQVPQDTHSSPILYAMIFYTSLNLYFYCIISSQKVNLFQDFSVRGLPFLLCGFFRRAEYAPRRGDRFSAPPRDPFPTAPSMFPPAN